MGNSLTVEYWVVVPRDAGSNPVSPALNKKIFLYFFHFMKTFLYIFILFSFFFQTLFTFIVWRSNWSLWSLFNYVTPVSSFSSSVANIPSLPGSDISNLFNRSHYSKKLADTFFFSNHNLDSFLFFAFSNFSVNSFFFQKFMFSRPVNSSRSVFINYSLPCVNVCRFFKFSASDFRNTIVFSKDFSFIFGSFFTIYYANSSSCIYEYKFVFSLSDFSCALYIKFFDPEKKISLLPVAFIQLSYSDYLLLLNKYSSFISPNNLDSTSLNEIFSSFFSYFFSTISLPSSSYENYVVTRSSSFFIKNIIYSNIDSRRFTSLDTPLDYYTFSSIPKTFFSSSNGIYSVRAFYFTRLF